MRWHERSNHKVKETVQRGITGCGVGVCRTGKVFDDQTGNNGVDKVSAMRRRG